MSVLTDFVRITKMEVYQSLMFPPRVRHILRAIATKFWWITLVILGMSVHFKLTDNEELTWAQSIKHLEDKGTIRIIVPDAPGTFQDVTIDFRGFDQALAQEFTEMLGLGVEFIEIAPGQAMIDALNHGVGDLAVGTLSGIDESVNTSPSIVTYQLQLVRHTNTPPPKADHEFGVDLVVSEGSREARAMALLAKKDPGLSWIETRALTPSEIFHAVATQQITYSVVLGPEFRKIKGLYPDVIIHKKLGEALHLGWSFSKKTDKYLISAAKHFIYNNQDLIRDLIEEHVNHPAASVADIKTFKKQIDKRLPKYRVLFNEAAKVTDWDPLMLIAVAYQESHLNPKARSPTGVRGIMMLTLNTMKELGYTSRLDPKQSIEGGARYLTKLRSRLPEHISEPDRTWFTLAAYNMGMGHLKDARFLTESQGGDPDRWLDVSARLPLLQQRKFYSKLQFGYGRGKQAQKYVENIRTYYELLLWRAELESDHTSRSKEMTK